MNLFDPEEHPHRRFNPLTEEWLMVSPQRAKRPWHGKVEKTDASKRGRYDPGCYLCPRNKRSNGETNPDYQNTFVFTNDFPALLDSDFINKQTDHNLLKMKSERGICKVICFSHRHDRSIPDLETHEIKKVLDVWEKEYKALGALNYINHVQIFENKGELMGCSNPHPHGQIWAQESVPVEVAKKQQSQKKYWEKNNTSLLIDYLNEELKRETRILLENDSFAALVPFWAVWPFETMIIPKRPVENITMLTEKEKIDFADAYKKLAVLYDNLFEMSFPYSAGIHQAPTDGKAHPYWNLHMSFYPPLLRSSTVRKFMVGYEMFAEPQRDLTPEASALILKKLPTIHYSKRV